MPDTMSKTLPHTDSKTSPRKMRCGKCKGCQKADCGKCKTCLDKPRFGGSHVMKKACMLRCCASSGKVVASPVKKTAVTFKQLPKTNNQSFRNVSNSGRKASDKKSSATTGSPKKSTPKKNVSSINLTTKGSSGVKENVSQPFTKYLSSKSNISPSTTPERRSLRFESPKRGNKTVTSREKQSSTSKLKIKELTDDCFKCELCEARFKSIHSMHGHLKVHRSKSKDSLKGMRASLPRRAATTPHKDIQLPKVAIDSMTKLELKEFIPQMMDIVTGSEGVWHNKHSAKPNWWPEDVLWANSKADWMSKNFWVDNLQAIIRNCYKYLGREDLLDQAGLKNSSESSALNQQIIGMEEGENSPVKTGSYPSSPVKSRLFPKGLFFPFSAEIYICYFCEKEFLNKEKMRYHQKQCPERPPELQKCSSKPRVVPNTSVQMLPVISAKPIQVFNFPRQPLNKFTEYIGLLPKQTAAKLREDRRSSEIDCSMIEDLEPVTPVTPLTPRTPKSLISQLSRDDASQVAKKRLTYSLSMDKDREKDTADLVATETESSDVESEVDDAAASRNKEMNLLNIPICSLLGQRIQKYVQVEAPMSVVDNSELFCRTPVKNTFLEKLRKKPPSYPIVYRPRRIANLVKENHSYKFSKQDIKEFMCRLNTGLNSKNLEKVKQMKALKVVVSRLSMDSLLRWVPRRVLDRQMKGIYTSIREQSKYATDSDECEFPSGPTLLAKNIDKLLGLKKRSNQDTKNPVNNSLSLGNYVSEEMEAEVSKQKLTLYRSLLYEMSVLKPTVVVEDLKSSNLSETGNNVNDTTRKSVASNKGNSKNKSNVSKIKTNKNVSEKTDQVEFGRGKKVVRKTSKPTSNEQLNSRATEDERNMNYDQTFVSMFDTGLAVCDVVDNTTDDKVKKEIKGEPVQCSSGASDFPKLYTSGICNVSPPVHLNRDVGKSPCDDACSVVSLSSDGESFHSGCCVGCKNRKLDLASPCKYNPMEEHLNMNKETDIMLAMKGSIVPGLLTLSVNTDVDILPDMLDCKTDVYGIPSPMSITSESPVPPTCTASTSEGSTPVKDLHLLPIVSAESTGTPRRSSRSIPAALFTADKSVQKSDFVTKTDRSAKSMGDSLDMPTANSVSLQRYLSRSRSLTPASSPSKMSTRSCNSLPNTPEKNDIRKQVLVNYIKDKDVSLRNPSKMMLRGGEAIITRSLSSTATVSNRNPYSLKSGNFIVTSPQKVPHNIESYEIRALRFDGQNIKSDFKINCSDRKGKMEDSPVRRSKRTSSTPTDGVIPTKLRKVYSDIAVQL